MYFISSFKLIFFYHSHLELGVRSHLLDSPLGIHFCRYHIAQSLNFAGSLTTFLLACLINVCCFCHCRERNIQLLLRILF